MSTARISALVLAICLGVDAAYAAAGGDIATASVASGCPDENYSVIDLLDPRVDSSEKREEIGVVERLAQNPDCKYERYLVGTLHRLGPGLPGNPLGSNPFKAVELIESYALSGRPTAFSDLAEMALKEGDARKAMQWTQVYLYLTVKNPSTEITDFDRRGYNANLLLRATNAWKRAGLPRGQIATDLQSYLSGKSQVLLAEVNRVRKKVAASKSPSSSKAIELSRKDATESYVTKKRYQPGYGVFLLEIQPTGKVSRIVPETFAPNYETGAALGDLLSTWEFNPFVSDKPIIIRVPVEYGYEGFGGASLTP